MPISLHSKVKVLFKASTMSIHNSFFILRLCIASARCVVEYFTMPNPWMLPGRVDHNPNPNTNFRSQPRDYWRRLANEDIFRQSLTFPNQAPIHSRAISSTSSEPWKCNLPSLKIAMLSSQFI